MTAVTVEQVQAQTCQLSSSLFQEFNLNDNFVGQAFFNINSGKRMGVDVPESLYNFDNQNENALDPHRVTEWLLTSVEILKQQFKSKSIDELNLFLDKASPNINHIIDGYEYLKTELGKTNSNPEKSVVFTFTFLRSYIELIQQIEKQIAIYHYDNLTDVFFDSMEEVIKERSKDRSSYVYSNSPL